MEILACISKVVVLCLGEGLAWRHGHIELLTTHVWTDRRYLALGPETARRPPLRPLGMVFTARLHTRRRATCRPWPKQAGFPPLVWPFPSARISADRVQGQSLVFVVEAPRGPIYTTQGERTLRLFIKAQ